MKLTKMLMATAGCAMLFTASPATADTVTTKTVVHQKDLPNVKKTNFSAFDLNLDGTLSMKEVGTKLFYIFDTDGNEVIDNIEFDHKQVMTIIPMEKDTYTYIDWDNDGDTDQATFTYETFFKESGLMRFDDNMDGLSAADFIEYSFLELDDDNSKVIELNEWKEAYEQSSSPPNAEQERYN